MPAVTNGPLVLPRTRGPSAPPAPSVVLAHSDLESMKTRLMNLDSTSSSHVKAQERALQLMELSKSKASHWDNTVAGARRKKDMEKKLKLQREEIERQRQDAEEARCVGFFFSC